MLHFVVPKIVCDDVTSETIGQHWTYNWTFLNTKVPLKLHEVHFKIKHLNI